MSARYPGLTPAEAALVDRVHHLEAALADAERGYRNATDAAYAAAHDSDTDRADAYQEDAEALSAQCTDLEDRLELALSDMHAAGIPQPVEPDTGPDLPIGGTR